MRIYVRIEFQLLTSAAIKSSSLVRYWQNRGRGISATRRKRNSPIHRCSYRDGMGSDWYVSCLIYGLFLISIFFTESVAQDLESFAKHASRTTVTTDDVLLITRRNDALQDIMKDFIDKDKAAHGKGKGRR